ncbi:sulfite reductase subunit alpha [Rhodococcus sp. (in: high G+C Gram-positive bacteria)]|uniref:sulfite reductase subunit alpha n=1 Tax=Rhodococcus sp. TaxID=1831 RepID=UPI0019ED8383|nr:sulfite reductase subunit alpha [Rhodococcus sp. (in: high G+C Gram-positive bacteria)]MBF0663617.1 sulfite reductase subunit alpha [Rhodococcus sp. (in: high G+C Gram-positive bacteria)]
MTTPFIPLDAPFTDDQRSWLAGFLAGMQTRLFSGGPADDAGTAGAAPVLHVLYGSQTGNAEAVAEDAAAAARTHGFAPVVCALDDMDLDRFASAGHVLIVTSTYGEGEMPDNAELFWDALSAESAPRLERMHFAVLALGDTGYDGFCQAGKLLDTRLEQLGAQRIVPRVDCDVDFEDAAAAWISETMPLVAAVEGIVGPGAPAAPAPTAPARPKSQWTRKNPYPATLTTNRLLSGAGSAKEIRHYEFALGESGIEYEAGDALNVVPLNDTALVQALLDRLRLDGSVVPAGFGSTLTHLLTYDFEITAPTVDLLEEIEKRTRNEELTYVLRHGDKAALDEWLWGRDILDVLLLEPAPELSAEEFLSLLRPLQHRAYSISSSPNACDGSVHLTVASVRYGDDDRERHGVCSTYLADRVGDGTVGIFVTRNKAFRVPSDDTAPMIMVGPGTGIAPFRGFLQERRARGATGKNWLFFGDQRRDCDYIYEDELAEFTASGVLTRLDLAFSRDQAEKIYVQTRMTEHGAELFAWLEEGGHFYICGDASRMAKDVDAALHAIVAEHGGMSPEQAAEYVTALKREKRYVRDVY